MLPINTAVAENLRALRESRRLSLDALSALTGVSKSMLAQIERGEANPTIATVWKIAGGLKVSFTELTTRPERDLEVVRLSALPRLTGDGGRYRNVPVFPMAEGRRFEVYLIELDPGALLEAAAHPPGAQEFLTVFQGEVEVRVRGEALRGDADSALRFKADLPHSYGNPGTELCRLSMVIHYA